jgi:hypothetical protein
MLPKKCRCFDLLLFSFVQKFLFLHLLLRDEALSMSICLFIFGYFLSFAKDALGSLFVLYLADGLVDAAQLMNDRRFL